MEQFLTTKLYIPPTRPELVIRSRLIEQLNEGLHRKLALISAPAGFGKTTLVSEWVSGCERPAGWLSLDEGDNDPTRFLAYFIAALNRAAGTKTAIGEGALTMLQSPQPPPASATPIPPQPNLTPTVTHTSLAPTATRELNTELPTVTATADGEPQSSLSGMGAPLLVILMVAGLLVLGWVTLRRQ